MPTYTYFDSKTNETIGLFQSMKEREQFLKDNSHMHQTLETPIAQIDPIMLGHLNKEGQEFQTNVINRIRDSVPGNNIKQSSRFAQNLSEI